MSSNFFVLTLPSETLGYCDAPGILGAWYMVTVTGISWAEADTLRTGTTKYIPPPPFPSPTSNSGGGECLSISLQVFPRPDSVKSVALTEPI